MCIKFLGQAGHNDRESRTRNKAPVSADVSPLSRDVAVRIVHAGGREELYQNVVPASQLMEKYPGMCVARPEVFKNPQGSLLWPEENLLPGQKYYIIPSSTAQKLKRNHLQKRKVKRPTEGKVDLANITWDVDKENSEESVVPAQEFYVSKPRLPRQSSRQSPRQVPRRSGPSGRLKKPFVPPLPRARTGRGSDWEPSLVSVQEVSP